MPIGTRLTNSIQPRPMFRLQNEIFIARSLRAVGRNEVARDEHEEADGQHAVDAHHRPVGVIGGELGADLVVAHDRAG